ncbi:MAG TPA: hypothetical protein VJB82_03395 [Candidatus Peribacterales bacterium]|nr:hypothetical protein [Candidatus Peribacterales bacterium]
MEHTLSRKGTLLFTLGLLYASTVAGSLALSNEESTQSDPHFLVPAVQSMASVTVLSQTKVHAVSNVLPVVDQEGIKPEDRMFLDSVLRWMTPLCRNHLSNLIVRYDAKAERGQATASTILLRGGMSKKETAAVLIHECGHVIDLGAHTGTSDSGESAFPDGDVPAYNNDPSVLFYSISWKNSFTRKSNSSRSDFVDGYSMQDPWEDLADSVAYYALHQEAFQERAEKNESIARKLAWVETYVFGPEFTTAPSEPWDGEIVWDVTKLEHGLTF